MNLVVKLLFVFAMLALMAGITGCATNEPNNASVRPWNAPQGWEGALPVDMGQHD
jgi:hypothetical protein